MMINGRPVSEDDLHAYVDELLDPERRARVERYLAEHPETASRIRAWQEGRKRLRQALNWKAAEPVPASLSVWRLVEARLARPRASWRVAAGIVLGLIVGAGGGWMARGPTVPRGLAAVVLEAVAAHRVFAMDLTHPVEFDSSDKAILATWATQRLGRAVTPPDLGQAGYHLVGGRLVATVHGPACLFLYDGDHGQRITLFVRPMGRRDLNAPMRPLEELDASGYAWARGGVAYGLVSTNPIPSLHDISNQIRDELQQGT
jgi:anti-sigma factor RsiW